MCVSVIIGTSGVPGLATRTVAQNDGGKKTGGGPVRRIQRGRSAQSAQEPLRASQSLGRKGQ